MFEIESAMTPGHVTPFAGVSMVTGLGPMYASPRRTVFNRSQIKNKSWKCLNFTRARSRGLSLARIPASSARLAQSQSKKQQPLQILTRRIVASRFRALQERAHDISHAPCQPPLSNRQNEQCKPSPTCPSLYPPTNMLFL